MVEKILNLMGYPCTPLSIDQFPNEEEKTAFYDIWHIRYPDRSFVLKRAKGQEVSIYKTFFDKKCGYAPEFYALAHYDGSDYLLMEYVSGTNLMHCNKADLLQTVDSLIDMQQGHWLAYDSIGSYEQSLVNRKERALHLRNFHLENAYDAYLLEFATLPRTLCHDDLLPFNVITSDSKAVFIDWEVGGILPYPTSLARLIAHGEDAEDALFYMRETDKNFAIDYYFDKFIKGKGIDYSAYRHSLDLFIFYEYCEWVYLGNKHNCTDSERYQKYFKKAINLAVSLGF